MATWRQVRSVAWDGAIRNRSRLLYLAVSGIAMVRRSSMHGMSRDGRTIMAPDHQGTHRVAGLVPDMAPRLGLLPPDRRRGIGGTSMLKTEGGVWATWAPSEAPGEEEAVVM